LDYYEGRPAQKLVYGEGASFTNLTNPFLWFLHTPAHLYLYCEGGQKTETKKKE